jgi:dihydrofolate synthase/folylpolyglutamate synthase
MEYLGVTIEKIAEEKAGIIKSNGCLITSVNADSYGVIKKKTEEKNALLIHADTKSLSTYKDKNIKVALKAWKFLTNKLDIEISSEINAENFLASLEFDGRSQYFPEHKIILDGAHNPASASELKKLLSLQYHDKKIIYIIGMLDKDYENFLKNLISSDSTVICTEPKSDRATKKESLAACVGENASKALMSSNLEEAIQIAKKTNHDLIVITGSLYLVGEALKLIALFKGRREHHVY